MSSAPALASAGVSDREAEVLALLGEHLSHAEIAARLFISVRTVESHVASLRRKLGVAGHRELIQLAIGWRAAETGRAPALAARLPTPLTSFVGRDTERVALAEALGQSRLVSLVGPGGIGKTRLALAVAADVAGRFPGGTWYADLVLAAEEAMLPAVVMTAIGLSESSSQPAEDVLAAGVRGRRALLVLDNCEHLANAVAALTERLLTAGQELVVLVTSRIRLVVPHERVYMVPGLSVPPDEPGDGDAVALFTVRAAAAGAAPGAGRDRRRVAGICRTLGGMPLAIELAAARLPSLGLDGLEAGLADQLGLLAGGSRQPARHQSLSDTLEWSYRLLDVREQAMLRRVAVFAAPFSLAAAVAVAGYDPARPAQVADALARLAEHSLLTPVTGASGTRYHALEPVRQFGAARLGPEDGQQTRVRHLTWCLATATGLDQGDTATPSWCGAFDATADDLRAALAWSAGQPGTQGEAYQLALLLARLLFTRGRRSARRSAGTSRPRPWPSARPMPRWRWNARRRPPSAGFSALRRCGWTGQRRRCGCAPVAARRPRSHSPAAPSTSTASSACTPARPPRTRSRPCSPTHGHTRAATGARWPRSASPRNSGACRGPSSPKASRTTRSPPAMRSPWRGTPGTRCWSARLSTQ